MKKQKIKGQDFTLPLIEQRQKNLINLSKSNSKRSKLISNDQNINTKRKQKEQTKPSNLRKQLNQIQLNTLSRNNKSKSLQKSYQNIDSQSDFEEKIKQNKRLLQNHKNNKQHDNKINDKENLEQLFKLPFINPLQLKKHSKLSQNILTISKNYDDSFTKINKNLQIKRSLSNVHDQKKNQKLNQSLVDTKNRSDIFEDIHNFLQSVNNSNPQKKNLPKIDKIYQKLQKYKQKLKKIDPNDTLENFEKTKQSYSSLKIQSQTVSEWKKINVVEKNMQKINTSFREELEKIGMYFNRTSVTLDQLLEHRKEIMDLVLLKKFKQKSPEKNIQANKRVSQFTTDQQNHHS